MRSERQHEAKRLCIPAWRRASCRECAGRARKYPTPDRELEVMHLLAEGLSNAQIAQRLVLSEKTVKGYVSNILSKLHVADRTQAAVFAWKEGMMRPG